MSDSPKTEPKSPPQARPRPRRRADARRSRQSILDAAVQLLNAQPDASIEAIAAVAGVTRQTVYAHFPSREHLWAGALDRVTEDAVAAMDAARLDEGPAAEALLRLLDAGRRTAGRYPVLMRRAASLQVPPQTDRARHEAVTDRLRRIIQRGQDSEEFHDRLPLDWLVTVVVLLGHAAGDDAAAGRMTEDEAADALRVTLLRVLGAES
ncbi:TetR/AcrR family transcriptional regulator [Streptomyces sp. NPDC059009]|uniref:TetR/AcrR family transcriptional regulator n=1 Tax=Streptomyces sp. NPDC059009 TaxID=3346694 RepID=UPI00368CA0F8